MLCLRLGYLCASYQLILRVVYEHIFTRETGELPAVSLDRDTGICPSYRYLDLGLGSVAGIIGIADYHPRPGIVDIYILEISPPTNRTWADIRDISEVFIDPEVGRSDGV